MFSAIYDECRNESLYAECRYAECRGAPYTLLLNLTWYPSVILSDTQLC